MGDTACSAMFHTPVTSQKSVFLPSSMAAAAGGAAAGATALGFTDSHGIAAVHGSVDDGIDIADHGFTLCLGSGVTYHALAGHDLAVPIIDALVQFRNARSISFSLAPLIVEIQTGQIEFPDHVLQFLVGVIGT